LAQATVLCSQHVEALSGKVCVSLVAQQLQVLKHRCHSLLQQGLVSAAVHPVQTICVSNSTAQGLCCLCAAHALQVVAVNITSPFINPSDTDDCVRFIARSRSFSEQVRCHSWQLCERVPCQGWHLTDFVVHAQSRSCVLPESAEHCACKSIALWATCTSLAVSTQHCNSWVAVQCTLSTSAACTACATLACHVTMVSGMQSFGRDNVTAVNATSTLLTGPVKVPIPIRNGSTNEPCECWPAFLDLEPSSAAVCSHLELQQSQAHPIVLVASAAGLCTGSTG
jgi:hypothetical protein